MQMREVQKQVQAYKVPLVEGETREQLLDRLATLTQKNNEVISPRGQSFVYLDFDGTLTSEQMQEHDIVEWTIEKLVLEPDE